MNRLKRLLVKETRKGRLGTLHYAGAFSSEAGHGGKAQRDISINRDYFEKLSFAAKHGKVNEVDEKGNKLISSRKPLT
jgi:hypothetical protein